jgi:hypothetical protein
MTGQAPCEDIPGWVKVVIVDPIQQDHEYIHHIRRARPPPATPTSVHPKRPDLPEGREGLLLQRVKVQLFGKPCIMCGAPAGSAAQRMSIPIPSLVPARNDPRDYFVQGCGHVYHSACLVYFLLLVMVPPAKASCKMCMGIRAYVQEKGWCENDLETLLLRIRPHDEVLWL